MGNLLITLQPHVGACRSPCKILPQKTRAADTLRHAQRGPPAYSAVGTALGLLPAGLLLHYLPYWYQTLAVPPGGCNTTGHHHGAPVPTEWRSCTHPQHTQPKPQGPTTTNLSKPNHPPASRQPQQQRSLLQEQQPSTAVVTIPRCMPHQPHTHMCYASQEDQCPTATHQSTTLMCATVSNVKSNMWHPG
jgi:hypothetical protein